MESILSGLIGNCKSIIKFSFDTGLRALQAWSKIPGFYTSKSGWYVKIDLSLFIQQIDHFQITEDFWLERQKGKKVGPLCSEYLQSMPDIIQKLGIAKVCKNF